MSENNIVEFVQREGDVNHVVESEVTTASTSVDPTPEMIAANPVLKRALELQGEDEREIEVLVNLITSLTHLYLDNSKITAEQQLTLADGTETTVRTQYLREIMAEVEKLVDRKRDGRADAKFAFLALAKSMNVLSRIFYQEKEEYLNDLRKSYENCVSHCVQPVLAGVQDITTRRFYQLPGSFIEYICWNDNLDKAAVELGMLPEQAPSDTEIEEVKE